MNAPLHRESAEALLTREARALLPLRHQLMLYLDPCAFLMNASTGTAAKREHALAYNCARRSILLIYIRRWLLIAASSFVGIASAEALAIQMPLFIIPAAGFGVGCSIAVAVAVWSSAAYFMLGIRSVRG